MLELFCCFLSRRKTHPILLIRSEYEVPMWISSHECLKLAVGECELTCCATNHLGQDGNTQMSCIRPIAMRILKSLINSKVKDLKKRNAIVHARMITILENFWIRGLVDDESCKKAFSSSSSSSPPSSSNNNNDNDNEKQIKDLKIKLDWNSSLDGKWIDRKGVSLLSYASCMNNVKAVQGILKSIRNDKNRQTLIDMKLRKEGFTCVGLPGHATALIGAMVFGSTETVKILLENGANPYLTDKNGNNPLMCACVYGRLNNVKFWMKRFKNWNLETRGKLGNVR